MSTVISTQFESLSNEILLDIFEYLDAYRMCQAFYGLNSRIDSVLQSARLHISCDLSTVFQPIWDAMISFPRLSHVRTLSVSCTTKIDEQILANSMENLRTISLHSVCLKSIDELCQRIPHNNQINCLSVFEKSTEWHNGTTVCLAHVLLINHSYRFLSLNYLCLSIPSCKNFPIVSEIFNQLYYLSLTNFCFSTNLLEFLRDHTPNFRSLKFVGNICSIQSSSMIVKHVYELHIDSQSDSSRLEGILSNFPSIRRLHIESQNNRQHPVLNGSVYQRLIERYCPDLKQLTIHFTPAANEDVLSTFNKNDFWSKKEMNVKKSITPIETISFGKEWHFQYFDNLLQT